MILFDFDVLARPGKELGARVPDQDGVRLWRMFHEQNRGMLGVVVSEIANREIFETWLVREGIKASFYEEVGTGPLRVEKIHRLSTLYGRADWYVGLDPRVCAELLKRGVRCFVYANPAIVLPEWHESRPARPWDELSAELDRQATLVSERTWGDVERIGDEE